MMRFAIPAGITAALLSILTIQSSGWQSRPAAPAPRPPAELLRLSLAAEKEGLAAPFKGSRPRARLSRIMAEVRRHLERTWFAWVGKTDPGGVFYYRIHSPVVLIEFDHNRPANLRHLAADPLAPNLEHIHAIVRTPNGNDYGKDLLRQHYASHLH